MFTKETLERYVKMIDDHGEDLSDHQVDMISDLIEEGVSGLNRSQQIKIRNMYNTKVPKHIRDRYQNIRVRKPEGVKSVTD